MNDKMIGLAEAAAHLCIPYQDAHRLLLTGKLAGEKRGSRWYVQKADVERLKARQDARRPRSRQGGAPNDPPR